MNEAKMLSVIEETSGEFRDSSMTVEAEFENPSDAENPNDGDGAKDCKESDRTGLTEDTVATHRVESVSWDEITPPLCNREKVLARLLRLLDHRFFQITGIIVLIFIIADGALFFFMLMGWHSLCTPRADCEPRNWIYNFSVQFLNGCFTYMVIVALPWRWAQLLHVMGWQGTKRNNSPGFDIYGQYRERDIWYNFPLRARKIILVLLHLNVYTQLANQATRIIFRTYEVQDTAPGVFWVNIFFALSFIFAGVAGVCQLVEERHLRKVNPGKFNPGLVEVIGYYVQPYFWWICPCCVCCRREAPEEAADEAEGGDEEGEAGEGESGRVPVSLHHAIMTRLDPQSLMYENSDRIIDPSRNEDHTSVLPTPRPGLRLWGL